MSVYFNNLHGEMCNTVTGCGHLGFAFNYWDDNNYDFIYKR